MNEGITGPRSARDRLGYGALDPAIGTRDDIDLFDNDPPETKTKVVTKELGLEHIVCLGTDSEVAEDIEENLQSDEHTVIQTVADGAYHLVRWPDGHTDRSTQDNGN